MENINNTFMRTAALLALLAGASACAEDVADPFQVRETGGIQGRLFFDANENGFFDPLGGDRLLTGVKVELRERGSTRPIGKTDTTDVSGHFGLTDIPLGTYDLYLDPADAPEVKFCQNPVPVTVYSREVQFSAVSGRSACLVIIADAEAQPIGTPVIVRGVVTSSPGQVQSGFTQIEDESGGIKIFDRDLEGQGIEVGDRIEIAGNLGVFGDTELQLTDVTLNRVVADFTTPVPSATTTGAISAAGSNAKHPLQGRFVVVRKAKLLTGFTLGGGRNAQIDDGSGVAELRVASGVVSSAGDIGARFTVGRCYDIVGVVGSFRGTGQLFPRTTSDWTEVSCS